MESFDTSVFFKSAIAFCLAFLTPNLHFSADVFATLTKLSRSSLVILDQGEESIEIKTHRTVDIIINF